MIRDQPRRHNPHAEAVEFVNFLKTTYRNAREVVYQDLCPHTLKTGNEVRSVYCSMKSTC